MNAPLTIQAQAELERRRRLRAKQPPPAPHAVAAATKIMAPQASDPDLPFDLWPAQVDVLDTFQRERLIIILKARQLGISWLVCLYVLWLCLFHPGKTVIVLSKGQDEADKMIARIRFMFERLQWPYLPALTTDNASKLGWSNNSHVESFAATKAAGRSLTASLLILDEFAFMLWGATLYGAAKPAINDGGSMIILSTADGPGSTFHQHWQQAKKGISGFVHIFLSWRERPDRDPEFRNRLLAQSLDPAEVIREYPENDDEAFLYAGGLVYEFVWSDGPEDGNVSEDADYIPDGGSVIWGLDDGYSGKMDQTTGTFTAQSHPRVILFIQVRNDGQLCVFDELYQVGTLSNVQISEALALPYPAPEFVAHGPGSAEIRGRCYEAGLMPKRVSESVAESIKELRTRLAKDANGRRGIKVHPRCTHFRKEMQLYRKSDKPNEDPIKQFDHGPDALRYPVWLTRNV